MKTYLLPCVCSADIPVGVGQAGGRVTCPVCARDVDVPKLRLLGNLRAMAPAVQPVETRWGVAHGLTLCGVVLALLAWTAALLIGSPTRAVVDATSIRSAVDAVSDAEIYQAWQMLARSEVSRPPTADEHNLLRLTRFVGGITSALRLAGGMGAVAAIVGGLLLLTRRAGVGPQRRASGDVP